MDFYGIKGNTPLSDPKYFSKIQQILRVLNVTYPHLSNNLFGLIKDNKTWYTDAQFNEFNDANDFRNLMNWYKDFEGEMKQLPSRTEWRKKPQLAYPFFPDLNADAASLASINAFLKRNSE